MATANNQAECLRQKLLDAKCGKELQEQCMALDSLDHLLFQTGKTMKEGVSL